MKKLYHNLKIIFPPFLGIFFIYLSVVMTSDEERKLIISYIINADLKYIISAIVFGILSHLSRAFRWKFLLNPLGYYPRFINSILAVLVSYIANLGIPRSGEILRATTLSNYEKIPFEKLFGTIIAERLIDFIILLSLIFLTLFLQFESIWEILREKTFDLQKLIAAIFILSLIFFGLKKFLGKNNSKILVKIKAFIEGLIEGIMSIKNMPYKLAFASHTIFIWTMYFSMFYIIKWTIPEMQNLQIIQMLPSFVIGGLTLTATNGGIGIYPLSVAMTLSSFGISNESGLAFG